jgi:hypothetical protein
MEVGSVSGKGREQGKGTYVSFTLQNNALLLSLCNVNLCLGVEELLAPVTLCLHLQLQLALRRQGEV